jgi:hypothetical protein
MSPLETITKSYNKKDSRTNVNNSQKTKRAQIVSDLKVKNRFYKTI